MNAVNAWIPQTRQAGTISLEHDLEAGEVDMAIQIANIGLAAKVSMIPVGQYLGDMQWNQNFR